MNKPSIFAVVIRIHALALKRALGLALTCVFTLEAMAHPPLETSAIVDVAADGRVTITVTHDALAFALNNTSEAVSDVEMNALLNGSEADQAAAFAAGRERFVRGCHLAVNGVETPIEIIRSPDLAALTEWKQKNPSQTLPCQMQFVATATLPADAEYITLQFPEVLAETLLMFRSERTSPLTLPLRPGEQSIALAVRGGATDEQVPSANPWNVAWRFVKIGFEHIIPEGLDHCLFVLGLFLLSPRIKPVLWQISAFTVAHTVTLTLTSLNIIGLPGSIVEPVIAASIAFIAVENLLTKDVHRWRYVVAFIFGLVHGMGIATAFHEAGFPPGQLVPSLVAFTVGVEAGHLAVLAIAFIALGWTKEKKWYRQRVAIPLSMVIAAIAMYWMLERVGAL